MAVGLSWRLTAGKLTLRNQASLPLKDLQMQLPCPIPCDVVYRPGRGIESRPMGEQENPRTGEQEGTGRSASHSPTDGAPIFGTEPVQRSGLPMTVWGVAALIVVVLAGALLFLGRKKTVAAPSTLQPADAYATSLPLTQFSMSESENLSGGKQTYLDGHIDNTGGRTVDAVTVQVVFRNDEQLAPQIDTLPLMLVRMKEPYIDTEPVGANPLKPGDSREFRLTFDTMPENWNQEMPEVRVVHAGLR